VFQGLKTLGPAAPNIYGVIGRQWKGGEYITNPSNIGITLLRQVHEQVLPERAKLHLQEWLNPLAPRFPVNV